MTVIDTMISQAPTTTATAANATIATTRSTGLRGKLAIPSTAKAQPVMIHRLNRTMSR